MNTTINDIVSNGIFQAVAAAAIVALITWIYKRAKHIQDEKKIYHFLQNSKKTYRSTEAITAKTGLTATRIKQVVSEGNKIRRSSKEKESWCLLNK